MHKSTFTCSTVSLWYICEVYPTVYFVTEFEKKKKCCMFVVKFTIPFGPKNNVDVCFFFCLLGCVFVVAVCFFVFFFVFYKQNDKGWKKANKFPNLGLLKKLN